MKGKKGKKWKGRNYNECEHGESDSEVFIVFRERRAKKKYRKYMRNEN